MTFLVGCCNRRNFVEIFNPPATDSLLLDLKAQYEVRLEEGLDTFVVLDGLPIVPAESKEKLIKYILKKLNTVGRTSADAVFMPLNDKNMSEGFVPFGPI